MPRGQADDAFGIILRGGRGRRADADAADAGGEGGGRTHAAVFEDDGLRGVGAEAAEREQIALGVGLAAGDVVGGDGAGLV